MKQEMKNFFLEKVSRRKKRISIFTPKNNFHDGNAIIPENKLPAFRPKIGGD